MEIEQLKQLIVDVKQHVPNEASELAESFGVLKGSVSTVMNALNDKSNEAFTRRDFPTRQYFDDFVQQLYEYEQLIEEVLGLLEPEDESAEKRTKEDYEKCLVDSSIPHSLNEDYSNIRPHSFKFSGKDAVPVKTWKDLMFDTCRHFYDLDQNKFASLENMPDMNGKNRKYFSPNHDEMRSPLEVGNGFYVETSMGGNQIRTLILKMLKLYELQPTDYEVFFRADYTMLKKDGKESESDSATA